MSIGEVIVGPRAAASLVWNEEVLVNAHLTLQRPPANAQLPVEPFLKTVWLGYTQNRFEPHSGAVLQQVPDDRSGIAPVLKSIT